MATVPAAAHGYPYEESANPHWVTPPPREALAHMPGEKGWPIVGNTLKLLWNPVKFGNGMREKYGSLFWTYSFGRHNVVMFGPDANELVLMNRDGIFSSEQGWGPTLNNLFPRGLMLMDAERHRADRKALSVAFKPAAMKAHCERLNTGIAERVAETRGEIRFNDWVKQLTLDLAASTMLGIPWGPEADKINQAFVDEVQASMGIVRKPLPFTKMGRGVAARQYLIDYFRPMVAERREKGGDDIFSEICNARHENGELLTEDEVLDHMNFFMMAAHDTITSSATSMIYYLAKYPEWQDKVREECLSIAPAGETVAYEDLKKFEITEMVFKEVLRMIPPVPSLPRRAVKDFVFRNHRIPAGVNVSVSPSFVHRMEEHWPEPDRFDPMRFTPEKIAKRHKYAWVPFGGGAHMCIGLHFAYMQIKILMHHLLTANRVELAKGSDYEMPVQAFPIPRPKDGLPVRLRSI